MAASILTGSIDGGNAGSVTDYVVDGGNASSDAGSTADGGTALNLPPASLPAITGSM
jgi:hypothetical protein